MMVIVAGVFKIIKYQIGGDKGVHRFKQEVGWKLIDPARLQVKGLGPGQTNPIQLKNEQWLQDYSFFSNYFYLCVGGLNVISETSVNDSHSTPPRSILDRRLYDFPGIYSEYIKPTSRIQLLSLFFMGSSNGQTPVASGVIVPAG